MTVAPGTLLAGYRIEGVAGRGGMGVVYRAVQEGLERPVALKLIAPELARDAEFRARFVRESRLAAALDHPHVIPVYEAGEEDGTLFIAMRWVEGPDLRELVAARGPLPPPRAAAIIAQVAGALDAAHARGLVHRDVKPANVLLAGDPEAPHAYLSDFGLARSEASSERLTRTGGVLGTASYSAPEQIEGGAVDGRADVYALACVLFFALTGQPPFRRDTELATAWAQVHEPPPSAHVVNPALPPLLDAALIGGLAKRPADRPATATELARHALEAVGGRAVSPWTPAAGGLAAAPSNEERTRRLDDSAASARTTRLGTDPPRGADAQTARIQRRGGRRRVLPWLAAVLAVGAAAAAFAVLSLGGDDEGGGGDSSGEPPAERGSSAPVGPVEPRPAGDVVRCEGGSCRQGGVVVAAPVEDGDCGAGGSWQRLDAGGKPALIACIGGAVPAAATVPDLAGARLDRAETLLDERGIDSETSGGGAFGVVVRENWTVCATEPDAGAATTSGTVTLLIDRSC